MAGNSASSLQLVMECHSRRRGGRVTTPPVRLVLTIGLSRTGLAVLDARASRIPATPTITSRRSASAFPPHQTLLSGKRIATPTLPPSEDHFLQEISDASTSAAMPVAIS